MILLIIIAYLIIAPNVLLSMERASYRPSILHRASKEWPYPALKKIIMQDKYAINIRNDEGKTPLIIACENNRPFHIINLLIQNGADPDISDVTGQTPLQIYLSLCLAWDIPLNEFIARLLISKMETQIMGLAELISNNASVELILGVLNTHNSNGEPFYPSFDDQEEKGGLVTASDFRTAVEKKDFAVVQSIFVNEISKEQRFTINDADHNGSTALHKACAQNGGNLDIVTYLVEQGAHVDLTTKWGLTAFMLACVWGHLPIVDYLFPKIVDIEACDNDQETALSLACKADQVEIVQFLLKKGADPNKIKPSMLTELTPAIQSIIKQDMKIKARNASLEEKKVGKWRKVYDLIINESITQLSENDVFEALGLTGNSSRGPHALLSANLLAVEKAEDLDIRGVYKILIPIFHEDKFFDSNQKAKSRIVNKMINQAYIEGSRKTSP